MTSPREWHCHRHVSSTALVSVSSLAIMVMAATSADAQTATESGSQLPAIRVNEPSRPAPRRAVEPARRPVSVTAQRARTRAPARRASSPAQPDVAPVVPASPIANTQDARTGTVGVYANSTSVATKTNTPLVNIPQSVSVVTREFIKDQSASAVSDVTRYVPGVAIHQGEGNRDELVIRGVDSSANFFVNGFRDDVQYYRDLYNAQSVEVVKGPSALAFGRGVGGGLLNRTLKEADGTTLREIEVQTGSYADRRVTADVGQAVAPDLAARLNLMYEKGDTFRDFGHLERFGVNPTITWIPDANTKVKLSAEKYHDDRTADRGNPSQALNAVAPSSTRFNPASPFAPFGDLTAFFGSPSLNLARVDVQSAQASVEHDFGGGLSLKNGLIVADYDKFYSNIYPGNGPLSGAVNPAQTSFNRAAYQNQTNRTNVIDQTDLTYKTFTGPLFHTLQFGTEFGRQTGLSRRDTGMFPNGTTTITADPFNPTYFGSVSFIHQFPGAFSPGVTSADAFSEYKLLTSSVYFRDTVDITGWLQLVAGARFDRFDLTANDRNTRTSRNRIDDKISPQAAVIFKPVENASIYAAYSKSYLPASGDQFSTLTNGTLILEPQSFENYEVGAKWNLSPKLLLSTAVYNLNRTNVPIADPANPGFFLLTGSHRIRGFETSLNGYITDQWQATLGYAYTDARITSATSPTIVSGNRVQLVPLNQLSLWNKYQFTPAWSASLGMIYFSDSFASSDNSVRLPGFVRFDAGVFYKINDMWKAQLTVENIFNKGYWASADGNNNLSPGQPRTIKISATARF